MSAGIQGVEPAVAAMKARLEDNLPDEIGIQNSEVDDGFELSDPTIEDFMVPPSMVAYPTVCILNGPGRFEDDTGFSATGVYPLALVCFDQDPDAQALARKMRRWVRTVSRVALANRQLGTTGAGIPWSCQLKAIDFGPTLSRDGDSSGWMSWVEVVVEVKVDEE